MVFTNHRVLAAPSLGIVVVHRDRHHISRVDLDDHGVTTVTPHPIQVFNGTEVQTSRTSLVGVIHHLITRHLTGGADAVVKLATVLILVILVHILVSKEVPIVSDGEIVTLKEPIQFTDCPTGRVHHQVLKELDHGIDIETITYHGHDATGQRVVQLTAVMVDDTTLNVDLTLTKVVDGLGSVGNLHRLFIVAGFEVINYPLVTDMVLGYDKGLTIGDDGDLTLGDEVIVNHSFTPCSMIYDFILMYSAVCSQLVFL